MRSLMLCVLGCCLAACSTPSIGPAYTDETIVHDDAYVGSWLDQDRTGRYRVSRVEPNGYSVRYERLDIDEPFQPVELFVVVFEIGTTRFFDVFPGESEIERVGERVGTLFLPVHNFGRLRMEEGSLFVDFLDMEWVNQQRATLETPHTSMEETVVLTAPPEAIQKLLARADATPGAFSDEALILDRESGGG